MCPAADDRVLQCTGQLSQQQLNAYMQFTEAREQLNEYEKQLETAKAEYETAKKRRWHRPM